MRTYVNERMEKEEKKRAADQARERRALLAEQLPKRRSGRLIVSLSVCREGEADRDSPSDLFKLRLRVGDSTRSSMQRVSASRLQLLYDTSYVRDKPLRFFSSSSCTSTA